MRQFLSTHLPDDSATRVAYRVSRPGQDPSLHGVWWPRSNDLGAELPAVIASLDSRGFRTEWVSFSRKTWSSTGQQLLIAGRIIRVASYRAIDPNMVSLSGRDGRARIDLLVVPPDSHPETAARAFARIVDWDNRITASDVLTAAEAGWADAEDSDALLTWPMAQAVPS
ncbi:hypothetical protein E1262_22355 [Jiangella aurantiaca]|uniref:Uncharacterized protein n=1 Tax=Jiangella aurantiaca TaxID=2530373 RepID=A0A4R5A6D2_9ACTN|nr:DUF5994 family protein [Jiangella aurantiaca]TDD66349.1 hypothetical protein E1262_22355 [Jiangella aurantiaca]